MNVPNFLTILRICAIPFFVVVLLMGHYTIAAIIFIIASLTDALDGYIARKYNLVTNFGKLMDPLADKLLVVSALVSLVELGDIYSWVVIIILSREFMITALRSVAASEGIVIAAGKSGKLKTVFQMAAITAILLKFWIGTVIGLVLLYIALVLTVYSGIEYMVKNKQTFSMNK